jgi:3-(3-hydroxy-phenyl)propionate hydroxylase
MHSSEHAFVGTTVPQPLVLAGANCEVQRLDDILGTGSATIGVDVTQDDWREVERTNFTPLGGRRVDIRLGDRLPIPTPGNYVVADADGRLEKAFAPAKGAFLLVRPDRMVAAVASRAQLQALSRELARFAPAAGTLRATPESAPDRDRSATATPTPFRIPNEGAITCD